MVKCFYCCNSATRRPYSDIEGKCVSVCDWHYKLVRPGALVDVSGYKECSLCGCMAKRVVAHHVCYFPELLLQVCVSCHNRIERGDLDYLRAPIEDKVLFYE